MISFKITNKSLEIFIKEGVPVELVEKLKSIVDKIFESEETFLDALEDIIGVKQTIKYTSLILKYTEIKEDEVLKIDDKVEEVLKDAPKVVTKRTKAGWVLLFSAPFLLSVIAILWIRFISRGLYGEEALDLSNIEDSRGLITFMIVGGTMFVAIILTLAILIGEKENIKERFSKAKEVLVMLVGILGTIVGFYFGSPTDDKIASLKISSPKVSEIEAFEDEEVTLTAYVSGGHAPYKYTIDFNIDDFSDIENKISVDGWIVEKIKLPQVNENTKLKFKITITDEENDKVMIDLPTSEEILIKDDGKP